MQPVQRSLRGAHHHQWRQHPVVGCRASCSCSSQPSTSYVGPSHAANRVGNSKRQVFCHSASPATIQAEEEPHNTLEALLTTAAEVKPVVVAVDQDGAAATAISASLVNPAQEEERRKRLWKAAIKLPMYSVGYIPVLVAGAAVFAQCGVAPWLRMAGFAVAAVFIIAWLNLSNDAFDASTGVDESKPESVVNLTGNWSLVFGLSIAFFVAGVALLGHLISATGDIRPPLLLAFSIACGYVYQGPPFRLSYKGVGEFLCFFAFGPSATPAFYLALQPWMAKAGAAASSALASSTTAAAGPAFGVASAAAGLSAAWQQAGPAVPASVWALSCLVGATTSIILFTSHFHQIEGDKKAGKMSPLVRLGPALGFKVLQGSVAAVYGGLAVAAAAGLLPVHCVLVAVASLPAAREMLAFAAAHHLDPSRIPPLKRIACHWHIAFGCSLALGLLAARLVRLPL